MEGRVSDPSRPRKARRSRPQKRQQSTRLPWET